MALTTDSLLAALAATDTDEGDGREHVLERARSAFLDFGIRRTSMGEIAKRSGISPATLYRWYKGKGDVVSAVLLRETRLVLAELAREVDPDLTPDRELAERAVRAARVLRDHPLLARLMETEPELALPWLTTQAGMMLDVATAYLAQQLNRFVDEGRIEALDAAAVAELLVRVVHSILLTPTASGFMQGDDEEIRRACEDLFRRLLRLPDP